jgi:3-dehydroquinate synthase
MVLAARYSARLRYISDDDAARVSGAIDAAGLPSEIAALGMDADGGKLAGHMLHDKKMDAGTLPFVLLRGIGEAFLDREVEMANVAAFLDEELRAG